MLGGPGADGCWAGAAVPQAASEPGAFFFCSSLPTQAFLSGLAVGLQMPTASRRGSAIQRAMVLVLLVCGLAVVAGSALLTAGVAAQHPRAVFYS